MKFNIIFLVAAILILATTALFDINYINYKKPVPFSEWKTISFHDFKGLKRPGQTLRGNFHFAFIKTSRKVQYGGSDNIQITSYFHPSRSYVFDQQIRNPDLLKHELYHFHITEYHSRLMRQYIQSFNGTANHDRITTLEKVFDKMEDEMQKQYDEETYHSYVLKEQKKWEVHLDSVLLSLNNFSDPVLKFTK